MGPRPRPLSRSPSHRAANLPYLNGELAQGQLLQK